MKTKKMEFNFIINKKSMEIIFLKTIFSIQKKREKNSLRNKIGN